MVTTTAPKAAHSLTLEVLGLLTLAKDCSLCVSTTTVAARLDDLERCIKCGHLMDVPLAGSQFGRPDHVVRVLSGGVCLGQPRPWSISPCILVYTTVTLFCDIFPFPPTKRQCRKPQFLEPLGGFSHAQTSTAVDEGYTCGPHCHFPLYCSLARRTFSQRKLAFFGRGSSYGQTTFKKYFLGSLLTQQKLAVEH